LQVASEQRDGVPAFAGMTLLRGKFFSSHAFRVSCHEMVVMVVMVMMVMIVMMVVMVMIVMIEHKY
jgi:hypothetical protein